MPQSSFPKSKDPEARMQAPAATNAWDFTPVLNLIHSFAVADQDGPPEKADLQAKSLHIGEAPSLSHSLGDFGSVLKSIGCSGPSPAASTTTKRVHWEDEVQRAALAGDHDRAEELINSSKLNKKERKAVRRRVGRLLLQKQALTTSKRELNSSSDDDRTYTPSQFTQAAANVTPLRRSARLAQKRAAAAASTDEEAGPATLEQRTPDRKALIHELLERPLPQKVETKGHVNVLKRPESTKDDKWPTADPVAAVKKDKAEEASAIAIANTAKVVAILRSKHPQEERYLRNIPVTLAPLDAFKVSQGDGLHIFIDASNILIGFHDALKLARSLPQHQRIRRQRMSFQLLSLILARGRTTAKQVVVGSDNGPEMAEAKTLGYETSILDRVHKAKELTSRQKRYANRESAGGTTSAGSGSETMAAAAAAVAQFAPEKWVEQGVDEILHLKMMESVVDATKPSTMVLATGDAAKAEFSGGFMRMVERALAKGWKVELACWKHNMSAAYRSHEFRQRWGPNFRSIELDDFAELIRVGP